MQISPYTSYYICVLPWPVCKYFHILLILICTQIFPYTSYLDLYANIFIYILLPWSVCKYFHIHLITLICMQIFSYTIITLICMQIFSYTSYYLDLYANIFIYLLLPWSVCKYFHIHLITLICMLEHMTYWSWVCSWGHPVLLSSCLGGGKWNACASRHSGD